MLQRLSHLQLSATDRERMRAACRFNAEVLDVTSLVGVQEGLLREITSLYFTRRRLMTFLTLSPPQDPGEKITESIRLDEITANLDALTGGFMSRELRKRLGT